MPTPITATNLDCLDGIRHGFFGRAGGVSGGLYASLNCGLGSGDAREAVMENRRRVGVHLTGRDRDVSVVTVFQIHSPTALMVEGPFAPGSVPKADALVTRTPGVVIGALAADCTPVLFADPEARVIGAAHAGWRGALGGVLEATITVMEQAGAKRRRIRAAIGPTINQESYEVGPEFEQTFLAADPRAGRYFRPLGAKGRAHFDLPGFVADRLAGADIASIERQSRCTYCHADEFFSYRRSTHRGEPDYGRQISAIVLT